jgi:hypothetical protein
MRIVGGELGWAGRGGWSGVNWGGLPGQHRSEVRSRSRDGVRRGVGMGRIWAGVACRV